MKVSEFTKNNPRTEELNHKIESHLREVEKQRFVRAFEQCGICGGELEFKTETDHAKAIVHEEAHCTCCHGKSPKRAYPLC